MFYSNMAISSISPELFPWLPGPLVTVEHKAKATSRVARRLKKLAAGRRLYTPETWKSVAAGMGIAIAPYFDSGGSRARLAYDEETDGWIIHLNLAYSHIQQASALVHELAHYFFHQARGEWLCDEPVVYYYEGRVDEEHHKLARDVERMIVQQWDEVPEGAGGLFGEASDEAPSHPPRCLSVFASVDA
jgi:hypothetical protein